MSDPIAVANIEIAVNTDSISQQMQKVRQSVTRNGALLEKNMLRNFIGITNAAKRMASQVQFALKAFTVPSMLVSGIAVKKLFSSDTEAGRLVKSQFEEVNKSVNEAIIRIGYFITQSKIFGKTMLEWLKAFADLLNKVTQRDVQIFLHMLSKALATIVLISTAIKAINFSQGFLKALNLIGATQTGSGAASGLGALLGGVGAGGAVFSLDQIRSNGPKDPKLRGLMVDAEDKRNIANWYKKFTPSDPAIHEVEEEAVAAEKALAQATVVGLSIGKKLSVLFKSILKWSGIFTLVSFAFDFVGGILSKILPVSWGIKDGLSLLGSLFKFIFNFLETLSTEIAHLGKLIFTMPGRGWSDRIKKQNVEFAKALQDIWYPDESSPEVKQKKQPNEKVISMVSREMDERIKALQNQQEAIFSIYDTETDAIMDNIKNKMDISKITDQVSKDKAKLEREITASSIESMGKISKEKDALERSRMGYSGQFVGGTELNKFQQRFQIEWTSKLIESNNNIADITQQSEAKIEETNAELKILNDNFDKFLKYVAGGLVPSDVALGLGL